MDHSSAALYRILYQNETLFRVDSPSLPAAPVVDIASVTEPVEVAKVAEVPRATAPIAAPSTVAPIETKKAPEPFPALQHKVLVLIDEPQQQEMLVSEALFLDNILKAVGHSMETSDVLNFSFLPGQDARTVLSGKKTNFFISFGVPLIKLHLDLLLVPYTPKVVEGVWFLLTDPLVVIEADRNLKKKLWQALQKMFEMS